MHQPTRDELDAAVAQVRQSPADEGVVELIVRRPAVDEREVLDVGTLSTTEGLVGDTWNQRGSRRTDDGGPHPDMQLNVINARASRVVAGGEDDRRPLAGDQLHLDLDLSGDNLPPGTRLAIGDAVIEVTDQPHTGCAKFSGRFGGDALKWVNSEVGRELNLRGINARVVTGGDIKVGDTVRRL